MGAKPITKRAFAVADVYGKIIWNGDKRKMTTISDLKFDDKNFNKHTEYGMSLLEKSLRELGAGRSIVVDKDNNIIVGNGIVEAAINAGITNTRVIETQGDELVVVKRTDMELNSKKGREMALADNATGAADLEWNEGNVASVANEFGIKTDDWGMNIGVKKSIKDEKDIENNPPTITSSFITLDYADEIQLRISDETATKLMDEMIKYRQIHGIYDGFWDERLKK